MSKRRSMSTWRDDKHTHIFFSLEFSTTEKALVKDLDRWAEKLAEYGEKLCNGEAESFSVRKELCTGKAVKGRCAELQTTNAEISARRRTLQ
jgi:hypothetical protein